MEPYNLLKRARRCLARNVTLTLAVLCALLDDRRCSAIETVSVDERPAAFGVSDTARGARQKALYSTYNNQYGASNPYGTNTYGNYNPYGTQQQRPAPSGGYYGGVVADFTQICAALANQQCGRAYASQCFCGGNVCCDPFNACCENVCFYLKYGGRIDYQCRPGPQASVDLEKTWCRCGAAGLKMISTVVLLSVALALKTVLC